MNIATFKKVWHYSNFDISDVIPIILDLTEQFIPQYCTTPKKYSLDIL